MNNFHLAPVLVLLMSTIAAGQPGDYTPQREMRPMLKIIWTEGPEYPMGIQESGCANKLVCEKCRRTQQEECCTPRARMILVK